MSEEQDSNKAIEREPASNLRKRKSTKEPRDDIWTAPAYIEPPKDEDLPAAELYKKRLFQVKKWLWTNQELVMKFVAVFLLALAGFFLLSGLVRFSTMSDEERASSSSRHSVHLTKHETVKTHELDVEMARLANYKTASEVQVSVFLPCTPVMPDEMTAGHVIIGEGNYEGGGERREDDAEERYEHVVVSIDDIVEYNTKALGEDGFAAPKFWEDPVPGLNPCILSIRSPNGFVTHMINPLVLNEREALDDKSYAELTEELLVSYVDVFPFWTRKRAYYERLVIQYNQWPGGEEFTRDLEPGSDVVLQIQDGIDLLESSLAYDRFMDGPAVAS